MRFQRIPSYDMGDPTRVSAWKDTETDVRFWMMPSDNPNDLWAILEDEEPPDDDDDGLSDVEADAQTLASAGMGTDEDYGRFADDEF